MDFEKFNKIKLKYNYLYFKNLIDKIKDIELCLIGPIIDEYVYVETTGIASKTPALASKFKKIIHECFRCCSNGNFIEQS